MTVIGNSEAKTTNCSVSTREDMYKAQERARIRKEEEKRKEEELEITDHKQFLEKKYGRNNKHQGSEEVEH